MFVISRQIPPSTGQTACSALQNQLAGSPLTLIPSKEINKELTERKRTENQKFSAKFITDKMASVSSDDTKLENNSCTDEENKTENPTDLVKKSVANIKRLQSNVLSVNISSSSSFNNVSTVSVGVSQASPVENCEVLPNWTRTETRKNIDLEETEINLSASFNALVTLDPK